MVVIADGDDGAGECAVHLRAQILHDRREPRAVELWRGGLGRERGSACQGGEDEPEAALHRALTGVGGLESRTTIPNPTGYPGGTRIGRWPVIGDRPSSARAAARSEARTPLQASRYDLTVGV